MLGQSHLNNLASELAKELRRLVDDGSENKARTMSEFPYDEVVVKKFSLTSASNLLSLMNLQYAPMDFAAKAHGLHPLLCREL